MLPSLGQLFPEGELPNGPVLLAEGRAMARDWSVGRSAFLTHFGATSEYEYKLRRMAEGVVMQHAQIGYRDPAKSCRAYVEIWESCDRHGARVDRYGLCLDWSMAVPRAQRSGATRGTGMILKGVEDFVRLANAAPVAPHFGDFVLGFPAAVENTMAALSAGSTAIGNLGQYYTFRVPGIVDDIETTAQTVRALGLIAAQPVPVLVHSNIDDGFAAQFTDLTSCLGFILLECDLIEGLVGAKIGHCFGHHFSDPLTRLAFQRALATAQATPGTQIYGNTTSYRGTAAQNFASLSSYLLVDVLGQLVQPTGHAINPVPVTENERIPEIDEVVEAQLLASRLKDHGAGWLPLVDQPSVDALAADLLAGAHRFRAAVIKGLAEMGIATDDVFQMLLALRRLGARRIEAAFGAGPEDADIPGGRAPMVPATILTELAHMADEALCDVPAGTIERLRGSNLRLLIAAGDVHEHGKMLIEQVARRLGLTVLDGGVSTDPLRLAELTEQERPDAIAISTYNGVALSYFQGLDAELASRGISVPVLIGGRLNQIPEGSNSSLPTDVGGELAAAGAIVCRAASELAAELYRIAVPAVRPADDP